MDGIWVNVVLYEVIKLLCFEYIFIGLDNVKIYCVVECVSGYILEYVLFKNGVVIIKNNKNLNDLILINLLELKVVIYGCKFVKIN